MEVAGSIPMSPANSPLRSIDTFQLTPSKLSRLKRFYNTLSWAYSVVRNIPRPFWPTVASFRLPGQTPPPLLNNFMRVGFFDFSKLRWKCHHAGTFQYQEGSVSCTVRFQEGAPAGAGKCALPLYNCLEFQVEVSGRQLVD